jgi:dihydrofolate reductase
MYETLAVWDTLPADGPSDGINQFANIWKAASKIIYSTSLTEVSAASTTIERVFNAEAINTLIASSDKDFNIGGPHLAAEGIRTGIIDEYHQFIVPQLIGSGNFWLPKDVKSKLKLVDLRKFKNGNVHLQYHKI